MLKALSIFILLLFSGQIMATEFESRQAFLLITAESGYDLRFDSKDPEIPSFSIETNDDYIFIPVSPGSYSVDNIKLTFEPYKINLLSLKKADNEWIKSEADLDDARDYLRDNYPVLKLNMIKN